MNSAVIIAFVEDFRNSLRLQKLAKKMHSDGAIFICADSGGDAVLAWGLRPALLIGDMDSISPQTLAQLQAEGVPIQKFPVAKDETDLELAVIEAVARGCSYINILGGVGGRLDQTLGNIFLLSLPQLLQAHIHAVIHAENEDVYLVQNGDKLEIEGEVGDLISLLPLSKEVNGIETGNLQYPLRHETLFFGSTRGISNVITTNPAHITFSEGSLLVIHRFNQEI